MNGHRNDPTQEQLDFLLRHDFTWIDGWNFTCEGKLYDLSAADILQIEDIKARGLFLKEWTVEEILMREG